MVRGSIDEALHNVFDATDLKAVNNDDNNNKTRARNKRADELLLLRRLGSARGFCGSIWLD